MFMRYRLAQTSSADDPARRQRYLRSRRSRHNNQQAAILFSGTQTWTDGGKTVTRACTGAVKRPLKPFLPRNKKQAAAW
jgi:hypothetical protein